MLRILLSVSSILAACAPSPQKAAMPSPSHFSGTTVQGSSGRGAGNTEPVAIGATPEPEHMAKNAAPGPLADSPAEARGRLILSTAFVRVGPDGHLTVELHNGHVLALRDVVMRPRDYCGVHVAGEASTRFCGGYAEVAAARPGGAPATDQPDLAAPNPVEAARGPAERK